MKFISRSRARAASGFSLIEVLVALAIGAVLAAIFIPNLISTANSANEAAALQHQAAIQDVYTKWVTLGVKHPATAAPELSLAILLALSGQPDETISTTPNYYAVAGDPKAIVEQRNTPPLPGIIRFTLSGAVTPPVVGPDVNGNTACIYSKFIFTFTPSSTRGGSWKVTVNK